MLCVWIGAGGGGGGGVCVCVCVCVCACACELCSLNVCRGRWKGSLSLLSSITLY